jgi:hypothetical protein
MIRQINKFYFLIHPTCWAYAQAPVRQKGHSSSDWFAALHWEQKVNARQKAFIEQMPDDSALAIYPSGDIEPMRQLQECAQRALGERCLIMRRPTIPEPADLCQAEQPIQAFVREMDSEGCGPAWSAVPAPLREPIREEIRRACEHAGYDWRPAALRVLINSYAYAQEITQMLVERDLSVDPASVTADAFGEVFEQCAMTWKAMTPHCLGWRNPVENDFNLSVAHSSLLFDARLIERLRLRDDIRVFIWEKSHERPMALFTRARCRLCDPRFEVKLPLDAARWEVWNLARRVWPREPAARHRHAARRKRRRLRSLYIPVYTGLRQYADDQPCYLIAPDLSTDDFIQLLLRVPIRTMRLPRASVA